MRILAVALVWSGLGPISAWAELPQSDAAVVEAYKAAIHSAQSGNSPGGIEVAFRKIDDLRVALMHPTRGEGGPNALESLSDEEFSRLERELPGVMLNRAEVVFVQPDLGFFSRLASDRGSEADKAFFAANRATYPDSVWPAYIEQQTDYSGCTRFGSMIFIELYRVWTEFQRTYPGHYTTAAQKEVEGVLDGLTRSACACDDRESVERELSQFNAQFPSSPARTKVEERLRTLRAGQSDIRFKCHSG